DEAQGLDVRVVLAAVNADDRPTLAADRRLAAAGAVADPFADEGLGSIEAGPVDLHVREREPVDVETGAQRDGADRIARRRLDANGAQHLTLESLFRADEFVGEQAMIRAG